MAHLTITTATRKKFEYYARWERRITRLNPAWNSQKGVMDKKEKEGMRTHWYELGHKQGKQDLIEKVIELLELDDRYAFTNHDQ